MNKRNLSTRSSHTKVIAIILGFCCWLTNASGQQDSTQTIEADSLLIQQLAQQMAPAAPQTTARTTPSTNPNISVIGDFRASYFSPASRHFDAEFHEAETALQSVVDPYGRADFFFAIARDEASGNFGVDLEEGYLTTQTLPAGLQLKLGKFRSGFGKINTIHPHALPFISVPNVYANYFGEEGLNDEGFSLSWLIPNPLNFYQELVVEATRGPADNASFIRSDTDRYLYLAHLKNFWELTPNATLEFGLSGTAGPNDLSYTTVIGGVDITYKWKPLRFNTYKSLVLQAEALLSSKKRSASQMERSWGMYALATWQLEKRWFLTGRFDYANAPDNARFVERAYSGTLGWYATEFQKAEMEIKTTSSNAFDQSYQIVLRSVFVIGAHGAHAY